jgi:hypothetical protein
MTRFGRDVFVNCPFDREYESLRIAAMFTIIRSGFRARCADEVDNAAENRFGKICQIIRQCRFGVHDNSRTETAGNPPLPRFNMPLELELFLGARQFGGSSHSRKTCIIFDRQRFRFQKYISDIAGQDIHSHNGRPKTLIVELATWLRRQSGDNKVPGGHAIALEFKKFRDALPAICAGRGLVSPELVFSDYTQIVTEYLT